MTIGVMVCGHGSRDVDAVEEFERLVRGLARRLPKHPLERGFLEFARPTLREGLDRLRARGVDSRARRARHAVRRRPRQERRAVGAQRLRRRACASDRVRARSRHRAKAARRGARPDRGRARRAGIRSAAGTDPARGGRPRHLRSRRQRQCRQGRAHAVGGHGLRLGRGGLQRRGPSARRRAARARRPTGLSPHRGVPLLPVHRRSGPPHLYPDRRGRRPASRDRVRQGRLSQRSFARPRYVRRADRGHRRRRRQHELPAVPVP